MSKEMRVQGFENLGKLLGMEEELAKMAEVREKRKAKARAERLAREEEARKCQVYKMTNFVLPDFEVFSPVVKEMNDAVNYFKENYSVEYPGCNIVQTEGINPKHGANFVMNAIWATPEEAELFKDKYGFVPEKWRILTREEQDAIMEGEYEKERRKAMYY